MHEKIIGRVKGGFRKNKKYLVITWTVTFRLKNVILVFSVNFETVFQLK